MSFLGLPGPQKRHRKKLFFYVVLGPPRPENQGLGGPRRPGNLPKRWRAKPYRCVGKMLFDVGFGAALAPKVTYKKVVFSMSFSGLPRPLNL